MSFPITAQTVVLSGKIIDKTEVPVSYANVILLAKDSTIVTGASTIENGSFILKNLKPNPYILKVSFVGYEDYFSSLTLSNDKTLEPIILNESTEALTEVTINAKRPVFKREADRLVYNVANTALSEGSMLGVLKSTPGVLVLDSGISIKNTTPTVYINDRKVNLTASDLNQLLSNTPANAIQKVEVITNPSAKYDAESGAVLNIVMSKNLITGYRGQIFSSYAQGLYPRIKAGINQFYKTKKVNLNVNYSYNHKTLDRISFETVNYFEDNAIREEWKNNFDRKYTTKNHNISLNFDYNINPKNRVSFSSNMMLIPSVDIATKGETSVTNQTFSNINSLNKAFYEKNNLGFDLDFSHRFDNKSKLLFNVHSTFYDYERSQDVVSDYFDEDREIIAKTAYNTDNNQDINILTSQIDYKLPLSEEALFLVGVKSSKIAIESDITHFDVNTSNQQQTLNTDRTDAFDYDESILAAYTNYENTYGKWSISAGLRLEQTDIEGVSKTVSQTNKQDYVEWFPTASLDFEASEKVSLYANYKRSIKRPLYSDLNPFNSYLSDNVLVSGNPKLQPAFIDHVTIGTTFLRRYTVEAYYKDMKNNFFQLPLQDNVNSLLINSPINIDNTREYGFDFTVYFNVLKNWSVYFSTSVFNIEDQFTQDNSLIKSDRWSNYTEFIHNFSFLKDRSLTANLVLVYSGKSQQGLIVSEEVIFSNLSLRKTLLKRKAAISLYVSDILNQQNYDLQFQIPNQDNRRRMNYDNRYIRLGFSYKFGNTNLRTNHRIKSKKETERLKGNN